MWKHIKQNQARVNSRFNGSLVESAEDSGASPWCQTVTKNRRLLSRLVSFSWSPRPSYWATVWKGSVWFCFKSWASSSCRSGCIWMGNADVFYQLNWVNSSCKLRPKQPFCRVGFRPRCRPQALWRRETHGFGGATFFDTVFLGCVPSREPPTKTGSTTATNNTSGHACSVWLKLCARQAPALSQTALCAAFETCLGELWETPCPSSGWVGDSAARSIHWDPKRLQWCQMNLLKTETTPQTSNRASFLGIKENYQGPGSFWPSAVEASSDDPAVSSKQWDHLDHDRALLNGPRSSLVGTAANLVGWYPPEGIDSILYSIIFM